MLFNSLLFLFVFLPVTLTLVLGLAGRVSREAAKAALFAASVVFYGYWDPKYTALLGALILFNYGIAKLLLRLDQRPESLRNAVFSVGLAGNLGALAYFKYTHFVVSAFSAALAGQLRTAEILLPLGISFITFQKIAFLVDVHGRAVTRVRFLDYCLFVTFFPQLIAGPIVHHRDILPQLERPESLRADPLRLASGITLFAIGLFKKVVIADALAPTVAAAYGAAAAGARLDLFTAWGGALHYLLQLYFDFSGYSDMAIGLGLMFGIHLPYNFNSPYKALGFVDYWQRWHITLTRFLTAYVYNPLVLGLTRRRMAAGKKSMVRGRTTLRAFVVLVALPTLFTMFVSGLWHGAGFQFIVFGLLHGGFLVVEHAYRTFRAKRKGGATGPSRGGIVLGRCLTLLGVLVASVFFRATSVGAGLRVLAGMFGVTGIGRPEMHRDLLHFAFVMGLMLATQLLPNSQELMGTTLRALRSTEDGAPEREPKAATGWLVGPRWTPSFAWGVGVAAVAFGAVTQLSEASVFLYFNF